MIVLQNINILLKYAFFTFRELATYICIFATFYIPSDKENLHFVKILIFPFFETNFGGSQSMYIFQFHQ